MAQPIDMKAEYGRRYRVRDDGSGETERAEKVWCQEIPGRRGIIYPAGGCDLCVSGESRDARRKFEEMGLRLVQGGDEWTFRFHASRLDEVAVVVGSRRRRQVSAEAKARFVAMLRGREKADPADSDPV